MIRTRGLTKTYGRVTALSNLSLDIEEGEIFGYIGPNGAGKTTTLKILATLLQPTCGSARIAGYEVGTDSKKIRPLIGYMPDFFGVYEDMSVNEYLTFFAAAYGRTGDSRERVVNDVLELTDLGGKRDTTIEALSRGMQQRLGLARTLVHDPKVLILDEPASGLDPRARIEIRELLKEVRNMGKTIMISSHILSELSEMCDSFGILEQGRLVFSGSRNELARRVATARVAEVAVTERADEAMRLLRTHPAVQDIAPKDSHLRVTLNAEAEDHTFLCPFLMENGFVLTLLREEEVRLEDLFMQLTKGEVS